jgi:NADH:ubiquinone oxidoreductase subunit 2 (subunit N)
MYFRQETSGSEPTMSPMLACTVAVAVAATIVLGVYPRHVFEMAQASAQVFDFGGMTAAIFR